MKPVGKARSAPDFYHLYPTTFRWNGLPIDAVVQHNRIYIPLRSDETRVAKMRLFLFWRFISHYVQMKLCAAGETRKSYRIYIPLRSDETGPNRRMPPAIPDLYPTTFRWNAIQPGLLQMRIQIYIPLRSDETKAAGSGAMFALRIYIPLRSDETDHRHGVVFSPVRFISHYVQMKLYLPTKTCRFRGNLYPTTFRWNGTRGP